VLVVVLLVVVMVVLLVVLVVLLRALLPVPPPLLLLLLTVLVQVNTTLVNLRMSKNKISNEGCIDLARGMRNNRSLRQLDILGCGTKYAGEVRSAACSGRFPAQPDRSVLLLLSDVFCAVPG